MREIVRHAHFACSFYHAEDAAGTPGKMKANAKAARRKMRTVFWYEVSWSLLDFSWSSLDF